MRDAIHFVARLAFWYGLVMVIVLWLAMIVMPELNIPALVAAGVCATGSIVCGYCRFANKWDEINRDIDEFNAPHIPSRPGADIARVVLAGEYHEPGDRP